jgi:NADPH:quinone reductase-like Zn-dependent oxidoreductase
MKAIVQDAYGDAGVLRLDDIDKPSIGPKDVLIAVRAAGVDRGAWHAMTGMPLIARLGFGLRSPRNRVLGMDVAGVVEAAGAEVTEFQPGDEVFGSGTSTWAEYARAKAAKLIHKPAHLTFEQAAALPTSGATARRMLGDKTDPNQKALVIGAGGGVGTFAVLLAKARGDHVTGVCSTGKVALVRGLGADHVIDYTRESLTGRYDLVVDIAGNRPLKQLRALLTPRGTLVIAGGENGGRWLGGMERNLAGLVTSPFSGHRFRAPISLAGRADLEALVAVTPAIDRVFPLADAPAAMRRLADGSACGKVILAV